MPNINKNIITQAGAAVANATNKAAGLTAATPEPGAIISAIQLVNGGRTIGPDALAHFTESVRNKLLSLLVTMEPIQDFNGYGHPWPAGGGKQVLDPSFFVVNPSGDHGVTASINADGTITLHGTATANIYFEFVPYTALSAYGLEPNVSYTLSGYTSNSVYAMLGVYGSGTDYRASTDAGVVMTFNENQIASLRYRMVIYIANGTNVDDVVVKPMICKTASSEPTVFAPYANICPLSGRTGLNVYAGPTSAMGDATTYSMDWTSPAGTVYAGSADIVSGDIKAAPYYASYNGETLVGPWVSSMDVYDPEGTPTTGAQVVDLGRTMTEYHITGQDIITLVGDNYIWSDSGDVTITE